MYACMTLMTSGQIISHLINTKKLTHYIALHNEQA